MILMTLGYLLGVGTIIGGLVWAGFKLWQVIDGWFDF